MAFSPDFLDELRHRLSLADIVGRKVRLTKRGREFIGLCPFHNEKTPSFTLNEEKGFYHCFGCGAHGDVVGFAMRADGLAFPEAVERLAEQAGLPVPQSSREERGRAERQATLLGALEAAASWFEKQLIAPGGRTALDYLKRRGLDDQTIARFRLGFAPDSRGALKTALAAAGLPEELLLEAGLLIRPEGGGASYDRFRGRVMFPIGDCRGRVIAFGGRTLGDGEPKYLNSPETPLFHKGRVLYGLAQATRPARDSGELIVTEGYMDVIALSQAGFGQAVAPLGTALTEDQIAELWKLVPEPILCFDGDAAGQRAAARAAERVMPLLRPGHSLRFARLPAGEDPDSLVQRQGAAAVRTMLDQARPLIAELWDLETLGREADTPERRAGLRQRLAARVAAVADREVQRLYRSELDRRLDAAFGYDRERRWRGRPAGSDWRRDRSPLVGGGQAARLAPVGAQRQQEQLLAALIRHPDLLHDFSEALAQAVLPTAELDKLRRAIIDLAACHSDLDSGSLRNHLAAMGFAKVVETVLTRTKEISVASAKADRAAAAAGVSHVLGMMEEPETRRESEREAQRLAEEMTDEALSRFNEAKRREIEDGESRRRDLDGGEVATSHITE
jgi:DNA primase